MRNKCNLDILTLFRPPAQPKFIPEFIRKQGEADYDVVSGTRYVTGACVASLSQLAYSAHSRASLRGCRRRRARLGPLPQARLSRGELHRDSSPQPPGGLTARSPFAHPTRAPQPDPGRRPPRAGVRPDG